MTRLRTDLRVTTNQTTQVSSILSGGGEITVVKTAFYSEPDKIAKAQLARILMGRAGGKASGIACGKMMAEAAGFEEWDRLTDEQQQDLKPAASIIMGQMSSDARKCFADAKGGRVGVVGSCGASRDGVSGH